MLRGMSVRELHISAKMNNNLHNDMILHFNERILIKKPMIINVN